MNLIFDVCVLFNSPVKEHVNGLELQTVALNLQKDSECLINTIYLN